MDSRDASFNFWYPASKMNPNSLWDVVLDFPNCKFAESAKIYNGVELRPMLALTMAEDTFIGTNAIILVGKLVMLKGSQINAGAILFGREAIYIGENSVISYGCVLGTSTDTLRGRYMNDASPESQRSIKISPITIGNNCFIGANCYIAPGVKVGDNTVIGAGSYISHSVPANKVVIPKQELTIKDREIIHG